MDTLKELQAIPVCPINKVDFTIDANGKAYISQSKTSDILGVPRTTIQGWIYKNSAGLFINEKNQLDAKSLVFIAKLGRSKYKQCDVFLDKALEGGVNNVIKKLAGYVEKPQSVLEMLETAVIELRSKELELEKSKAAKKKIYDDFIDAMRIDGYRNYKEAADRIGVFGFGRNTMLKCLKEKHWLSPTNKPYRSQLENGRFVIKTLRREYEDGSVYIRDIPLVTEKGIVDILGFAKRYVDEKQSLPPIPLPPTPTEPTVEMIVAPFDVEQWYKVGWTDDLLIAQGKAK